MTRAEAFKMARKLGAFASDSLDASTNILVAGAGAESKIREAKKRGVRVLDEDSWMKIVKASPRAKQTELSLWGWGIDVECARLTKREAEQIMRKGISEDELSDLFDCCTNGPTDCYLIADDDDVRQIMAEPKSKPYKWGGKNRYFVVKRKNRKGEWGRLVIDGDFDENKLSIEMASDDIYGATWTIFCINYDGKEFEYIGTETKVGPDYRIITPDGETEDFEIIDGVND